MEVRLDLDQYGFKEYKAFDLKLIRFDQEIRDLCNAKACPHFGKNHMCPPFIQGVEAWKREILSFDHGVIVTKVYPTQSSFDMKSMIAGAKDFENTLEKIKDSLETRYPGLRKLVLGAGPCLLCENCTCVDDKPCRFPEQASPAIEACGIDVMSLSKQVNVNYHNGKNTVTYLGAVIY